MSENITKLDYAKLREFAERIHKFGDRYGEIVDTRLYGSFKTNLKNAFDSDDATSAMAQLDKLKDDFAAMQQTIEAYSKHLYSAADAYEETKRILDHKAQNLTGDRS